MVEPRLVDLEIEETDPIIDRKSRMFGSTPPKRNVGRPKVNAKPKVIPDYKAGAVKAGFEELYGAIGTIVMLKDPHCGMAVIQSAADAADALEELAKTNPSIRRVLMSVIATNSYGKVIAAHLPILMAIFAHHIAPKMNGLSEEDTELMMQTMSGKKVADDN